MSAAQKCPFPLYKMHLCLKVISTCPYKNAIFYLSSRYVTSCYMETRNKILQNEILLNQSDSY
ncbi:hypothetical protein ACTXT7_002919 [Hymenolepis weldensis]